jgi:hypothetical protein
MATWLHTTRFIKARIGRETEEASTWRGSLIERRRIGWRAVTLIQGLVVSAVGLYRAHTPYDKQGFYSEIVS